MVVGAMRMRRRRRYGRWLRTAVAALFYYSGAFQLMRWIRGLTGQRVTIVTYHRIAEGKVDEIEDALPFLFVSRATFEKQVAFMKRNYSLLTFKDLGEWTARKQRPRHPLIITFDDGYADNMTLGAPVLKKRNAPSTMFLPSALIGEQKIPWWDEVYQGLWRLAALEGQEGDPPRGELLPDLVQRFMKDRARLFLELNRWEDDRIERLRNELREVGALDHRRLSSMNRLLGWEELREMKEHMDFGSHGHSHSPLDSMAAERLREELFLSKKTIEAEVGAPVTCLAYPAGACSETVMQAAAEAGYAFAVTQESGVARLEDRFAMSRINLWEGTTSNPKGRFSAALFALALGAPHFGRFRNRDRRARRKKRRRVGCG
jgi:peptidoglycan/xylan/chitin deacetylase (PgdA/CDA1 family)